MNSMRELGYMRVGAGVPEVRVGDVGFNTGRIKEQMRLMEEKRVEIALFPSLSLTGATCGDLYFQSRLLEGALEGLSDLLAASREMNLVTVAGLPLMVSGRLYSVSAVFERGRLLGIVPKTQCGGREVRWFSAGEEVNTTVELLGQTVPCRAGLVFAPRDHPSFSFSVTQADPMAHFVTVSRDIERTGALIILNPGARKERMGGAARRCADIKTLSEKFRCGYVYCGAGMTESTTFAVYAGQAAVCEAGWLLAENGPFSLEGSVAISEIDCKKLQYLRRSVAGFVEQPQTPILFDTASACEGLTRTYLAAPFVPSAADREARCAEAYQMLAGGLARRMMHTGLRTMVLGISGGLDSTLAFLAVVDACDLLGKPHSDIICVTMPGFGTTGHTYENAVQLVKGYGAQLRDIDIREACLRHFADIGHDLGVMDATYENAQARERTQILMDIANQENGLVIGTGDMSELALGWCTYNGDHMSMYSLNASIAKTFIPHLVRHKADLLTDRVLRGILYAITETPISPELLPPNGGDIKQKTEDAVGPYRLQDFFLFHFLKNGAPPEKLLFLAERTFAGEYTKTEIKKWLRLFLTRFFSQQFKRNCTPDGPQIGSVSLAPGNLVLPGDAAASEWIKEWESDA